MLDIDGTIIPYEYDATPSLKVIEAIRKAVKKGITVCLVTGRALESTEHILNKLNLKDGIVVTNGGGAVFDIKTRKPLYLQPIDKKDSDKIIELLRSESIEFFVKKDMYDGANKGPFKKDETYKEAYMIFADEYYDHSKIVRVFDALSENTNLTLHKTRHKDPKMFGFNATHAKATKLHGIEIIMKHFGLKKEEIIGVGDGYNDFPLLMASGLKVAMGNAVDDLKEIADYVAPDVKDDGVSDVVYKFILNESESLVI